MTRRMRRLLWTTLSLVTLLVVLAVGVFPTRQYLDQRSQTDRITTDLKYLKAENERLEAQIDHLGTAEAIERIARDEHNYVRPLEENYTIVVPTGMVARFPSAWPY